MKNEEIIKCIQTINSIQKFGFFFDVKENLENLDNKKNNRILHFNISKKNYKVLYEFKPTYESSSPYSITIPKLTIYGSGFYFVARRGSFTNADSLLSRLEKIESYLIRYVSPVIDKFQDISPDIEDSQSIRHLLNQIDVRFKKKKFNL